MDLSIFVNMKIENHIAQLLYRYQCVTVPGFGAFLTNNSSAEVNSFTQTFTPPRKNVLFNTHLKNNDGLLANHIATIEKINYESAVINIENSVENWKQLLQTKETIVLKNIGTIKNNEFGTVIFEESQDINFLSSSFGLNSYVSPTIKREVEQFVESISTNLSESKVIKLQTTIQPIQKNNYFNYAAAAIISIGTLGFVGNTFYNQQIEAQNQVTQSEVRKEVNQKIQEATFFISNPLQYKNIEIAEAEKCFHIVAGSFRSERNLKNLLKRMTILGYNPKALPKDSIGVSQVLFGSYSTFATAQKELEKIQVKENPEAWILIKKL